MRRKLLAKERWEIFLRAGGGAGIRLASSPVIDDVFSRFPRRRILKSLMTVLLVPIFAQVLYMPEVCAQTQPKSPLPQEAVTMMFKLVGTWINKSVRNGEAYEELYQARWNASKSGLTIWGCQADGSRIATATGYWDSAKREYVESWAGEELSGLLRYGSLADDRWDGTATIVRPDGMRHEGTVSVEYSEDRFVFTGEAGPETAENINTRITLEQSEAAMKSWAEFVVGGTWVNNNEGKISRHSFSWRPGNKVLLLDRQGGKYPGLSLITMDYQSQCVRWHEIDDNGMAGSAVFWQSDKDTWRLMGHYESKTTSQALSLTLRRTGPDQVTVEGTDTLNGESETISNQVWNRERK